MNHEIEYQEKTNVGLKIYEKIEETIYFREQNMLRWEKL